MLTETWFDSTGLHEWYLRSVSYFLQSYDTLCYFDVGECNAYDTITI